MPVTGVDGIVAIETACVVGKFETETVLAVPPPPAVNAEIVSVVNATVLTGVRAAIVAVDKLTVLVTPPLTP